LSDDKKKLVLDFMDVHLFEGKKSLWGIIKSNGLPAGADYFGLSKYLTRFNHSCSPNVSYDWDDEI